jgi:hypothetical protein
MTTAVTTAATVAITARDPPTLFIFAKADIPVSFSREEIVSITRVPAAGPDASS